MNREPDRLGPVGVKRLNTLEITAHHEAAHCVLDYLMGFPLEFVLIDETTGVSKSRRPRRFRPRVSGVVDVEEGNVIALLAGFAAECEIGEWNLDLDDARAIANAAGESAHDLRAAQRILELTAAPSQPDRLPRLYRRTTELLREYWPLVAIIATKLTKGATGPNGDNIHWLNGSQATAIIARAVPQLMAAAASGRRDTSASASSPKR